MEFKPGFFLVILGAILILLGIIMSLDISKITEVLSKTKIGNLPGDIVYKKDNFTFYFPLATSIIISVILTVVLNLVLRIFK
ncbi:MAG: DUF2905 domain-containing protein [Candidatus Calescibacterium sp.]|nr:DUF2905 domain-containing protein [Candidatus Calescibacterium sp.]MCX7734799.1 DUF2905 domain-containing protein [bacterium]MDW8087390.1 DUF2905 domain-containing protein [Candidatus Calescibacterium sp.]